MGHPSLACLLVQLALCWAGLKVGKNSAQQVVIRLGVDRTAEQVNPAPDEIDAVGMPSQIGHAYDVRAPPPVGKSPPECRAQEVQTSRSDASPGRCDMLCDQRGRAWRVRRRAAHRYIRAVPLPSRVPPCCGRSAKRVTESIRQCDAAGPSGADEGVQHGPYRRQQVGVLDNVFPELC